MDAVVKVYCVHTEPNYSLPWQRKRQYASTSSGFMVAGPDGQRWLLTNAHSVEYHSQVCASLPYLLQMTRARSHWSVQKPAEPRLHKLVWQYAAVKTSVPDISPGLQVSARRGLPHLS